MTKDEAKNLIRARRMAAAEAKLFAEIRTMEDQFRRPNVDGKTMPADEVAYCVKQAMRWGVRRIWREHERDKDQWTLREAIELARLTRAPSGDGPTASYHQLEDER